MARALAVMALLWPLAQAASVVGTVHGSESVLTAAVRIVGSRICHRRPERSFHTAGVQWPVCARCSGVYVGAAVGVWWGFATACRRWIGSGQMRLVLLLAALPTAVSWMLEWGAGVPVTNVVRAWSAVPLGAAAGAAIVAVVARAPKLNQVN